MSNLTITDQEVLENYFKDEKVTKLQDDGDGQVFRITNLISFCDNDAKVINDLNYRYHLKRSGRAMSILIFEN